MYVCTCMYECTYMYTPHSTLNMIYSLMFVCFGTGALGVMFEYGVGVPRDSQAAFKCLKDAAIRGNVYAQGNLALHYYNRKLFNKAADVSKR